MPIDLLEDVLLKPPPVSIRQRIALDKPLGEADDANLEAARQLDRCAGPEGDFHAAAADIDDDRSCAADVDAVHGRLMDQPRFLGPGDDHRDDAGFALDAGEELAAVARLAGGAGRRGKNLVHAVRIRQPFERRQRLQRGVRLQIEGIAEFGVQSRIAERREAQRLEELLQRAISRTAGTATPIMQSRVTIEASLSSLQPSVPAGRIGSTM